LSIADFCAATVINCENVSKCTSFAFYISLLFFDIIFDRLIDLYQNFSLLFCMQPTVGYS